MIRLLSITAIVCAIYFQHPVPAVAFETDLMPGEGKPVIVAKMELKLREKPSTDSLLVKGITIPKGQRINFIETIYRTKKSGLAKVHTSFSSPARTYGTVDSLSRNDYYFKGKQISIDLKEGDTIEYLQERAEGSCFIRYNGEIMAFDLLVYEFNNKLEIIREPETELWVRVIDGNKKSLGWMLLDANTVKEIDRE